MHVQCIYTSRSPYSTEYYAPSYYGLLIQARVHTPLIQVCTCTYHLGTLVQSHWQCSPPPCHHQSIRSGPDTLSPLSPKYATNMYTHALLYIQYLCNTQSNMFHHVPSCSSVPNTITPRLAPVEIFPIYTIY